MLVRAVIGTSLVLLSIYNSVNDIMTRTNLLIPCDLGDKIDYGHLGEDVKIGVEAYGAYVTAPNTTSKGGVIVISDIFGWELTNTRAMVDMLAMNGYHAILPDAFYGNPAWNASSPWSEFGDFVAKNNPTAVKRIVDISIDYLKNRFGVPKFGVLGFCWGGLSTHFLMADEPRDDLVAGVSCYGQPLGISNYGQIKKPTFFIFGEKDFTIPSDQVNMLKGSLCDNKVSYKVRSYKGQGHGFVHRKKTGPNDPSKTQIDRARRDIIRWFNRYLALEQWKI